MPRVSQSGRIKKSRAAGAQTVARAIHLLRLVASSSSRTLRVIDLAALAGLERSTAHRLLQRLVEERMVVRDSQARGYRLGPLVYELGLAALPETNLREAARPYLQLAAQQTGDMVFLLVRSGFESVCLDQVAGNFAIQTRLAGVGDRHPLGVGAGSLAMLAAMDVEDREIVIGAIAGQLAPYGLDEARLRERIDLAVQQGFALDQGETFPEVAAVGLAIRDRNGASVGAVFVASIRSRMTEGRILEARKRLEACVRGVEAVIASGAALHRR